MIERLASKVDKLNMKAQEIEPRYKNKFVKAELERRKRIYIDKASNLKAKIKRLERVRLYYEKRMKEKEEKKREKEKEKESMKEKRGK